MKTSCTSQHPPLALPGLHRDRVTLWWLFHLTAPSSAKIQFILLISSIQPILSERLLWGKLWHQAQVIKRRVWAASLPSKSLHFKLRDRIQGQEEVPGSWLLVTRGVACVGCCRSRGEEEFLSGTEGHCIRCPSLAGYALGGYDTQRTLGATRRVSQPRPCQKGGVSRRVEEVMHRYVSSGCPKIPQNGWLRE